VKDEVGTGAAGGNTLKHANVKLVQGNKAEQLTPSTVRWGGGSKRPSSSARQKEEEKNKITRTHRKKGRLLLGQIGLLGGEMEPSLFFMSRRRILQMRRLHERERRCRSRAHGGGESLTFARVTHFFMPQWSMEASSPLYHKYPWTLPGQLGTRSPEGRK